MHRPVAMLVASLIAGCAQGSTASQPGESSASEIIPHVVADKPSSQFLANLVPYCGKAYAGRIVADQPKSNTPDPFEGKSLVMHVSGCEDPYREIRIPFHVGDDRSRTWVITRTATGLRLKHDHRHQDGSPDTLTMYGGDTVAPGSVRRQEFPADAESRQLFQREGRAASMSNTWAMELVPSKRFVYELGRPDGRLFQVEFDLTRPIATPPPAWGALP